MRQKIFSCCLLLILSILFLGCPGTNPQCQTDEVLKDGVCVKQEPTCKGDEVLKDGVCVKKTPDCKDDEELKNGVCVKVEKDPDTGSFTVKVVLKGASDADLNTFKAHLQGPSSREVPLSKDGEAKEENLLVGDYVLTIQGVSTQEATKRISFKIEKDKETDAGKVEFEAVGSLAGKVTKSGKNNHAGALIMISELSKVAASNSSGGYFFERLPVGTYTLLLFSDGYESVSVRDVKVTHNQEGKVPDTELKPVKKDIANKAPLFVSKPASTTKQGVLYSVKIEAKDPENEKVTLELVGGPIGMKLDASSGQLTWNPSVEQVGSHTVAVSAKDPEGNTSHLIFSLIVTSSWKDFTRASGLPDKKVKSVIEGKDGDIWVSQEAGITRIQKDGKRNSYTPSMYEQQVKVKDVTFLNGGKAGNITLNKGLLTNLQYKGGEVTKVDWADTYHKTKPVQVSHHKLEKVVPNGGLIDKLVNTPYKGKGTNKTYNSGLTVTDVTLSGLVKIDSIEAASGYHLGTVSSSTGTTLSDLTAKWTVDEFKNKYVISDISPYQKSCNQIISNDATSITTRCGVDTDYKAGTKFMVVAGGSIFRLKVKTSTKHNPANAKFAFIMKSDKKSTWKASSMVVTSLENGDQDLIVTGQFSGKTPSTISGSLKDAAYIMPLKNQYSYKYYLHVAGLTPSAFKGKKFYFLDHWKELTVQDNTADKIEIEGKTQSWEPFGKLDDFLRFSKDLKKNRIVPFDNTRKVKVTYTDANASWNDDEHKGKSLYVSQERFDVVGNTKNTFTIEVQLHQIRANIEKTIDNFDYFLAASSNPHGVLYGIKVQGASWQHDEFKDHFAHFKTAKKTFKVQITGNTNDTLTLKGNLFDIALLESGVEVLISSDNHPNAIAMFIRFEFQGATWTKEQLKDHYIRVANKDHLITASDSNSVTIKLSPAVYWQEKKKLVKDASFSINNKSKQGEITLEVDGVSWNTDAYKGQKVYFKFGNNEQQGIVSSNTSNALKIHVTSSLASSWLSAPPKEQGYLLLPNLAEKSHGFYVEVKGASWKDNEFKGYYLWSTQKTSFSVGLIWSNGASKVFVRMRNVNVENIAIEVGDIALVSLMNAQTNTEKVTFTDSSKTWKDDELVGHNLLVDDSQLGYYTVKSNKEKTVDVSIQIRHLLGLLAEKKVSWNYVLSQKGSNEFHTTIQLKKNYEVDELKGQTIVLYNKKGFKLDKFEIVSNTKDSLVFKFSGKPPSAFFETGGLYYHWHAPMYLEVTLDKKPSAAIVAGLTLGSDTILRADGNKVLLYSDYFARYKLYQHEATDLLLKGQLRGQKEMSLFASVSKGTIYATSKEGIATFKDGKFSGFSGLQTLIGKSKITKLMKPFYLENPSISTIGQCQQELRFVGKNWKKNQWVGALISNGDEPSVHVVISSDNDSLSIMDCSKINSSATKIRVIPMTFTPSSVPKLTPKVGDLLEIADDTYQVARYENGVMNVIAVDNKSTMRDAFYRPLTDDMPIQWQMYQAARTTYKPAVPHPKGGFWIGGYNGLFHFENGEVKERHEYFPMVAKHKGTVTKLRYKRIYDSSANWKPGELKDMHVRTGDCSAIIKDNGKDWLETSSDTFHRNSSCGAFVSGPFLVTPRKGIGYSREPTALVMDGQELWGAFGSVAFHKVGDKWEFFTESSTESKPGARDGISGRDIRSIIVDGDQVWFASSDGVSIYNKKSKTWQRWNVANTASAVGLADGLAYNNIYAMVRDKEGKFWFGTGQGLSTYDPKTKKWMSFFSDFQAEVYKGFGNSQLLDNRIHSLTLGKEGLLVGTDRGLSIFAP